jgi:hypothetical protein
VQEPSGSASTFARIVGDGCYVVVHLEEIRGIMLCLYPAEVGVFPLPAEGFDDAVHLVEVEHVYVDALPHSGP